MKYNFDEIIDRRNTNSIKWAVKENELPLTVADMDFKTAPEIVEAIKTKVATGVFGYEMPTQEYFDAVRDWYRDQHQAEIKNDWQIFVTGVVPAISSIVRRLTRPAEKIVVQTPVYNMFFHSIENNGRFVNENKLVYDPSSHTYQIDFDDLAERLADPQTTMMILCNPQNPTGIVWSKEDLLRILELCHQNHVVLVSDEIHGGLVLSEDSYHPIFSVSEELRNQTITLVSPSKTFNVAALHAATAIVPDPDLRYQVSRGINNDELAEPNLAAIPGSIAAYCEGKAWLTELKGYLRANRELVKEALQTDLKGMHLVDGGATYLLWLDCSSFNKDASDLVSEIRQKTGLILADGGVYRGNGKQFMRMAIACPKATLKDALERLTSVVRS